MIDLLPAPRERDIQKAIIDLLKAHRIPCFRMNSGDRFGSYNGKKWRIRGHEPGTPDLLAAPKNEFGWPHFLWVEVKTSKGVQSDVQKNFQQFAEANGMFYLLARSVDDVIAWLAEHKL